VNDIQSVKEKKQRDEAYWRIFWKLKEVEQKTDVIWAYLMVQDGESYRYLVVTTDTDDTAFEEEYPEYIEFTKKAFQKPYYYSDRIEYSRYGRLLPISVPVYAEDGSIAAVLAIDYNAEKVLRSSFKIKTVISMMCVVCSILVSLISVILINHFLERLNLVADKMEELTSSRGDLTQRLESGANDEIGKITRNMNEMLEYIQSTVLTVANTSVQLRKSMEKLAESSKESTQGTENVSEIMKDMNAMMQRTNESVVQITTLTTSIQGVIEVVERQIMHGQEGAKESLKVFDSISEQVEEKTNVVKSKTEELMKNLNSKIEQSKDAIKMEELSENLIDQINQIRYLVQGDNKGYEREQSNAINTAELLLIIEHSVRNAKEMKRISGSVIQSVLDLAMSSNQMIQFVTEATMTSYHDLYMFANQYKHSTSEISEWHEQIQFELMSLNQTIHEIEHEIREVSDTIDKKSIGISQITATMVQLDHMMRHNQEIVQDGIALTQKLGYEVNKFIYD